MNDLNPVVKFDPRFYVLNCEQSTEHASLLRLQGAWKTPFGVFLFPVLQHEFPHKALFISRRSPAFLALNTVLKRMMAWESQEKQSLTSLFWRMNVLR